MDKSHRIIVMDLFFSYCSFLNILEQFSEDDQTYLYLSFYHIKGFEKLNGIRYEYVLLDILNILYIVNHIILKLLGPK